MINFFYTIQLLQTQNSLLLKSDKVYSVLAILVIIFSALILYLFLTDRKTKAIEAKIEELKK